MNTLGRRGILITGAVVGVIVLVAGWFLMVAPLKSDIKKTKAATATQDATNDSAQLTLATMRAIAKKLPQEKAELAALNERVPNQVEIPALLRAIQSAATTTGITLTSLTPSQPVALTGAPGISTVGIQLSITGGYAEIEQFDSALESLRRTFLVSGFSLAGGGKSSTESTDASIIASFSGQVLVSGTAGS